MARKNQTFYFCEVTDTFGGDANYSWVRRYKVKATTKRGAVLKVARDSGYSGRIRKDMDTGDMTRHNVQGAAICIFTEWFDEDNHGQYTLTDI